MLEIRKEQSDAFLLNDEEKLVEFIIEHLQEESPELIDRIPADGLQEMVQNGLVRASSHGLRSLENLTAFVSVMFEIAPNFDEQPEIKRMLCDPTFSPEERFDLIFDKVSEKAWEEAEQRYDHEAWFPELKEEHER